VKNDEINKIRQTNPKSRRGKKDDLSKPSGRNLTIQPSVGISE